MIDVEVNLTQQAVAFASSGDVLHLCRTKGSEVFGAVQPNDIIHPSPFKVREWRCSFASNAVPRIPRSWLSHGQNLRCGVEITFINDALGYKVVSERRHRR